MRVLVAGASGVVGRPLVPLLTTAGHEVVALSRRPRPVQDPAVRTLAVDALDDDALAAAVHSVKPDAVVHLLTAIPHTVEPKRFAEQFATTNRLRVGATRTLLAAAGGARVITQSVGFTYDLQGARPGTATPADEDVPSFRTLAPQFRTSMAALVELERLTARADGLALRFGHLYGPGTAFAADGSVAAQLRTRQFPLVGGGTSVFSFVHVQDAARAVLAALDSPMTGALNVVDDHPAPTRVWQPELATLLGAPAPRAVPRVAARLAAGEWGATFTTSLRGASNARARSSLDWTPDYASWRDGFAAELSS